MKILDKEEEEHITQVCQAFSVKQDKLSIEKPTTKNLEDFACQSWQLFYLILKQQKPNSSTVIKS